MKKNNTIRTISRETISSAEQGYPFVI